MFFVSKTKAPVESDMNNNELSSIRKVVNRRKERWARERRILVRQALVSSSPATATAAWVKTKQKRGFCEVVASRPTFIWYLGPQSYKREQLLSGVWYRAIVWKTSFLRWRRVTRSSRRSAYPLRRVFVFFLSRNGFFWWSSAVTFFRLSLTCGLTFCAEVAGVTFHKQRGVEYLCCFSSSFHLALVFLLHFILPSPSKYLSKIVLFVSSKFYFCFTFSTSHHTRISVDWVSSRVLALEKNNNTITARKWNLLWS